MMTIKQLADKLGVSKTAIRKHFTDEFRTKYTQLDEQNHHILINETGCKLIAESFRKSPQTTTNKVAETTENQVFADIIATLKAELEIKNKQIEDLSTALAAAQQTASQAQALHAATITKQLQAPKKSIFNIFKKDNKNNDN